MREGVRPKTKLHVICDMCVTCYVMLCYVLCVRLLRSWVSRG